jgi:hypothetical protein
MLRGVVSRLRNTCFVGTNIWPLDIRNRSGAFALARRPSSRVMASAAFWRPSTLCNRPRPPTSSHPTFVSFASAYTSGAHSCFSCSSFPTSLSTYFLIPPSPAPPAYTLTTTAITTGTIGHDDTAVREQRRAVSSYRRANNHVPRNPSSDRREAAQKHRSSECYC